MHSCPDCGQACYCHGDIDDCEVETEEYASEHCVCDCAEEGWREADEDDDHGAECVCNECCDRRAGNAPQPEDA